MRSLFKNLGFFIFLIFSLRCTGTYSHFIPAKPLENNKCIILVSGVGYKNLKSYYYSPWDKKYTEEMRKSGLVLWPPLIKLRGGVGYNFELGFKLVGTDLKWCLINEKDIPNVAIDFEITFEPPLNLLHILSILVSPKLLLSYDFNDSVSVYTICAYNLKYRLIDMWAKAYNIGIGIEYRITENYSLFMESNYIEWFKYTLKSSEWVNKNEFNLYFAIGKYFSWTFK